MISDFTAHLQSTPQTASGNITLFPFQTHRPWKTRLAYNCVSRCESWCKLHLYDHSLGWSTPFSFDVDWRETHHRLSIFTQLQKSVKREKTEIITQMWDDETKLMSATQDQQEDTWTEREKVEIWNIGSTQTPLLISRHFLYSCLWICNGWQNNKNGRGGVWNNEVSCSAAH